ncbi:MAG: YbhB/YbcL family Raf kinase inhibitor-like protein, partial [Candidatus Doudnabacteria bacterium CG10_big_fil_rev_8_21_14_0_10_42_18]
MKKILIIIVIFIAAGAVVYYWQGNDSQNNNQQPSNAEQTYQDQVMNITSYAFENNQPIPAKYTCDGENTNPPLEFLDVPA